MAREPIHPGETLCEDLDALGMSAAELARWIEVPVNRITEILNGAAPSPATRRCAWGASSGRRASSGSTSRSSTNCAGLSGSTGRRSPGCRRCIPVTGRGRRLRDTPAPQRQLQLQTATHTWTCSGGGIGVVQ